MAVTADVLGKPFKVTGTTAADDTIIDNIVYIQFVYWLQPTTVGHLCTLTNKHGREIITMRCEVAGESQAWPIWGQFDGIHCTDMDSGTLYIYTP